MKAIGLARLGRDAELKYAASGDPVANFSAAYDFGQKDQEGNRQTQWITFALFGTRAEKLVDYLKKGKQFFIMASDLHVRTYEKRDGGQGFELRARVDDIQFCGNKDDDAQPREAAARPRTAPAPNTPQGTGGGIANLDDDIPF